MNTKTLARVLLFLLAGCGRGGSEDGNEQAPPPAAPTAPQAPRAPSAPSAPQSPEAPKPPQPTAAADPKSAEAALDVVAAFAGLLKARRYADAHRLWSGDTANDAGFARRFAGYDIESAAIGKPGPVEGAAGSLYVDVPLQLFLAKGDYAGSIRGTMTLRRANDVPGSTAEQRRWHIVKADLRPAD